MSNYPVYICQAVRNRAGLARYWQVAPAAYPENGVDVLAAYAPCEVLHADQDERVPVRSVRRRVRRLLSTGAALA